MDGVLPGGFAEHVETFREKMRNVARLQQERANLIATASAQRRRVTATVNADGVLIDLKFSSDIDDLEYPEVAAAITEACGLAVAKVGRRAAELFAPLPNDRGGAPDVDEIVRAVDNLRDQL
jgi:DNA-binding protein YbaB